MRLSESNADSLPGHVIRPVYDRDKQQIGIVHLGLGAFHRAHQALYTDDAMNHGDRDWLIAGVSLRSPAVRNELAPQDCLYTVAERGLEDSIRLVGSIARVHVATESPESVIADIAANATRIVTITVTEKGYHRRAEGSLDLANADIAADLDATSAPRTLYGFLREGLARRRDRGMSGITVISCDNLQENGSKLAALLKDFLERSDPELARWVQRECAFPSTMVDRIVPATTDELRADIEKRIGMRDAACVATESFCQWVIEDHFAGPRPRWEAGGAELVTDVRPYETAKLRILNGAHSALAYLGLERGYHYVHEAIDDVAIRSTCERLMRLEAAGSFTAAHGQNLDVYCDTLLARFANQKLQHRLAQIAMDGSQKIPQRWLATLQDQQRSGRSCSAILEALAAWIVHVKGEGDRVDDPAAQLLAKLWVERGRDGIVSALFGERGHFGTEWVATPEDVTALHRGITKTN